MEGEEDELRVAEPSAAEQLAELQLLSRFERPMMPVALGLDVVTESEHEEDQGDNDDDEAIRLPTQHSASSFTALLAASRRLAGSRSSTDASSAPAPPPVSPVHINIIQRVMPRNSMVVSDHSKTTAGLPTLSEEDDDNEDRPEMDAFDSERPPEQEEEQEEEEDDDAFDDMLRDLAQDHNLLLLSVSELTDRRLGRARDMLSRGFTTLDKATHLTPTEQMRWTRSIVAVSTLSLLIKHFDVERVRRAVTDALSRLDEPNTHESEHLTGFLTSSNITRVVLMARESLHRRQMDSTTSHSPVDSNSNQAPGRVQASPSPSPSRVRSPCSSTSRTASSPHSMASPRRVSILAREGTHVLMNEKIVAFEHRPHVDQLPMFKVRRDSARVVEDAAKRRQRALQYAQEIRKGGY